MNRFFRDNWKLLKKGGRNMFLFEISYKMITSAIAYPLLILLVDLTVKIAGVRYLTNEHVIKVVTNPIVIGFLMILLLIFGVYVIYEMIFITSCYEFKNKKRKVSLVDLEYTSWKIFVRIFKRKNWIIAPFAFFSVFAINISILLNILILGTTNNLWISHIKRLSLEMWILIIVLALIIYIPVVSGCFVINIFVIEGKNFKEAFIKSFHLVRKHMIRTVGSIILYNIAIIVVIILIYVIISVILIAGVKILDMAYIGSAIYLSALRIIRNGVKILLVYIAVPTSFTMVSRLYYKISQKSDDKLELIKVRQKKLKLNRSIYIGLLVLAITLNITYVVNAFNKNPFDKVAILSDIKITAHRGSSKDTPENTMAAFEKAVADLSDYIELDVQQTSDGVVVVIHDTNVYRTTGVDRNIWEMTLEEVKELDAGSYFSEEFAGEKIPTLDEVIKFAKGKIKLNIEIKASGNDIDLVKNILKVIKDNNFVNNCVITSFDYETLKEIKKYDQEIEVGYILSIAYGDFYNMDDIDFFSVNASFLSKLTVDSIHNSGKQVHAWTVNNSVSIKNIANKGVDNIITDVPITAREVIYSRNTSETLINMIKYVFNR